MNIKSIKKAVIIIPLYKMELTKQEKFSITNTLKVLSKWDIFFIAPYQLKPHIDRLHIPLATNRCIFFENKYFKSITGYNRLLMSRFFYERFAGYEFMLIVQTDAIVISDQLDLWCSKNYSYVGAPWFEGLDKPIKPYKLIGVGNGGFSLRKIHDFIAALSDFKYIPNNITAFKKRSSRKLIKIIQDNYIYSYNFHPFLPDINEDVFWGILIPRSIPTFTVPTVQEAAMFSFEVCPEYLFQMTKESLPFGCHAWEKYNKKFWKEKLNLPDL